MISAALLESVGSRTDTFLEWIESGKIKWKDFLKDFLLEFSDTFLIMAADAELRNALMKAILLLPLLKGRADRGIGIKIFNRNRYIKGISSPKIIANILPIGAQFYYYLYKLIPARFVSRILMSKLIKKLIRRVINFQLLDLIKLSPITEEEIEREKIPIIRIDSDIFSQYLKDAIPRKRGPAMVLEGKVSFVFAIASQEKLGLQNINLNMVTLQAANMNSELSDRWIEFMIGVASNILQALFKKSVLIFAESHLVPILDSLFTKYGC